MGFEQIWAIFYRRFFVFIRSPLNAIVTLLISFFFALLPLIVSLASKTGLTKPPPAVSFEHFDNPYDKIAYFSKLPIQDSEESIAIDQEGFDHFSEKLKNTVKAQTGKSIDIDIYTNAT